MEQKETVKNAETNAIKNIVKRKAKDSVFTNLFSDTKYIYELYQALHPEDKETTQDDLEDITCSMALVNDVYNDLGFRVKDKVLILVEAQSTWSVNIIVRAFLYLAKTYQEYFDKNKYNLYKTRKVQLPKPELYVVYTKERQNQPEEISLSQEFFEGDNWALELRVKVLYGKNKADIIGQYVGFCKVLDKQVKIYGRTKKAIEETIRICKNGDILKEYLTKHEREVHDIMFTLYDEEEILRNYAADIAREAEEKGIEKGIEKGMEKGMEKGIERGKQDKNKEIALNLSKMGMNLETISMALNEKPEIVNEWLSA